MSSAKRTKKAEANKKLVNAISCVQSSLINECQSILDVTVGATEGLRKMFYSKGAGLVNIACPS